MSGSATAPALPFGGVGAALAAAALFGASTPLAKLLLSGTDPWMLAGLLYLGSGFGLAAIHLARRSIARSHAPAVRLSRAEWGWLGAAILCGGIAGPVLLMFGLAATTAASASLLLNLEGVLTALLAWYVFRENFDRRIALGMAAISAGAIVLAWTGTPRLESLLGPLAVTLACLAWALDNNLTRKVALGDPLVIAMLKGLVAGVVNVVLALALGARLPAPEVALGAGVVGLAGYGLSLALFVVALRHLGTARTGAYFSTTPFVGAAIAIVFLAEPLSPQFIAAALLMGVGVWLHLTERHDHEHIHEPTTHSHRHVHDAHHQHAHGPGDPPDEPHTHTHTHAPIRHKHPHYPDAHHRHEH